MHLTIQIKTTYYAQSFKGSVEIESKRLKQNYILLRRKVRSCACKLTDVCGQSLSLFL